MTYDGDEDKASNLHLGKVITFVKKSEISIIQRLQPSKSTNCVISKMQKSQILLQT